jgi:GNAT superfamily N-acetyltransferase
MSKDTDEKINNAITDVLTDYKKLDRTSNIQKVDGHTTIYIIPVKLLGHNGNGLYFVHPSSQIYPGNSKLKPQYSTAYVIPQDPKDPHDYTNINYIDVPKDFRGKGIASKLLEAVEQWCRTQSDFSLIRLENDTDINPNTGSPSTLYEKAGYHYLNASVEFKFGDKKIMRSAGNEMEKVINDGHHSEDCQFRNRSIVPAEVKLSIEDESELLVCIKSGNKKRDHWKHIDPKNMIGKIDTLVLRSGTIVHKPKPIFKRRVKGFSSRSKVNSKTHQTKIKGKRSRSKVKVNTRNKSKRVKL